MLECRTGRPDLLATRSAFASRRLLSVSSGEGADEFEDLPACGQHVSFSAQYAYIVTVRRQDAASVIEALLLDLLMIVFTLLALGLARAGKSARAERVLILACAVASSYMNVSAADVASLRSIAAYAIAPIALAVVV